MPFIALWPPFCQKRFMHLRVVLLRRARDTGFPGAFAAFLFKKQEIDSCHCVRMGGGLKR